MRILIGDANIQDRMALQKYLGTFGECQTVETAQALTQVFRNAMASQDERFKIVIIDAELDPHGQLFDAIRSIEWEAGVQSKERCAMIFTGTLAQWMQVSGILGDNCDTFISKPLKKNLLYTALANLGFEHIRKKTEHAVYDGIITSFLDRRGEILVLAEDSSFFSALRRSLDTLKAKHTTLAFSTPETLKKHVSMPMREDTELLLFMARTIDDKLTTEYVRQLRMLHEHLKIIILTSETEDFNIAYLHDIDADNVLTLPASLNNIFEKMANTIHPPTTLQHLMQEARIALGRKDYKKALSQLDEALTLKPYSPGVLLLQGDIHREMGDDDKAIAAYEEAHISSSLYLDPLKRLAEMYQDRAPEKALVYLEKLDLISPNNPRRKVEIGNAKLNKEGIEVSRRYYDQGIDLAKKEKGRLLDDLVHLIAEKLRFRFPKVAIAYIDDLIKSKRGKYTDQDLETFNRRGILLRQEGNWKEAIANYRKALKVSPDSVILKYNLMMAFMEGRDFAYAMKSAKDIMASEPDFIRSNVNVAYNMARLFQRQGHSDMALKFVTVALGLDPEHAPSLQLRKKLPGKLPDKDGW